MIIRDDLDFTTTSGCRQVLLALPCHRDDSGPAGAPHRSLGPGHEGHGEQNHHPPPRHLRPQSMKPFWTMSGMSTLDGSPKLERQVDLSAGHRLVRLNLHPPGPEAGPPGLTEDRPHLGRRLFLHHQEHHHQGSHHRLRSRLL